MFPVAQAKLITSTPDCFLNGDECMGNGRHTATESVMERSNNVISWEAVHHAQKAPFYDYNMSNKRDRLTKGKRTPKNVSNLYFGLLELSVIIIPNV